MAEERNYEMHSYEGSDGEMYNPSNNQLFARYQEHARQQTYQNLITSTEQYFVELTQQNKQNSVAISQHSTPLMTPPLDHVASEQGPIKSEEEPKKARGRKGVQFERQFASDEKEMLINLWHNRPILWDSSIPEYLDTNKKQLAIKEISVAMSIDCITIGKQMKSLKSYYGSLRQSYEGALKNGANIADVKKPTWPYYEMLKFLDENFTPRNSNNNLKRNDRLLDSSISNKSARITSSQQQETLVDIRSELLKAAASVEDFDNLPTIEASRDEDDIFGELVAKSMKKIHDCVEKEELKIEIQSCILKTKRKLIE